MKTEFLYQVARGTTRECSLLITASAAFRLHVHNLSRRVSQRIRPYVPGGFAGRSTPSSAAPHNTEHRKWSLLGCDSLAVMPILLKVDSWKLIGESFLLPSKF